MNGIREDTYLDMGNVPAKLKPSLTFNPDAEVRSPQEVVYEDGYLNPVEPPDQHDKGVPQLYARSASEASEDYIPMTVREISQDSQDSRNTPDYYNLNRPDSVDQSSLKRQDTVTQLPTRLRNKRKASSPYASKQPRHIYGVNDTPAWYMCIILAFQHFLVMFGATVSNPLILAPKLCIQEEDVSSKSWLIGTVFVTSGVGTLLQTTLGVRLPLVQGGSFNFVTPIFALLSLPKWQCPTANVTSLQNMTTSAAGDVDLNTIWLSRIREVQGAIIMSSLFQIVIGFGGLTSLALRYIGPLSITPTISLAGLALFDVASEYCRKQWWITLVTVVLIAVFSQYTRNINIPCVRLQKGHWLEKDPVPIFRLFPIILAVSIVWILCAILTATGVFPQDSNSWGHGASTNSRIDVLKEAPWFQYPYPGQWGVPTFSVAGVFGMLAGTLAGIVESVGDYYACARISGAPPPPVHAVNRGIAVEGIACFLCGLWGSGSGTTTFSENIGAIGITKVASRRVMQVAAIFMMLFGIFGKFGALFVTIPDPIIGGVFIVMFGMVTAVGLSNLQFVNLNSSRNLFIIGFSFFFGLSLPKYLDEFPEAIQTGNDVLNNILVVLLKTSMFVGGLAGFVLDNTIPGSDVERGLIRWRQESLDSPTRELRNLIDPQQDPMNCYEIPALTKIIKRWKCSKYMPFLPTFQANCCHLIWRTDRTVRNDEDVSTAPGSPTSV